MNNFQFQDLLSTFETGYGADIVGCTVMRIRGRIMWKPDTVGAFAIGMRVFTESTLADLDDDQSPINDPHADWFMYETWQPTATSTEDRVLDVDIKSRRKFDELGQGLLLAFGVDTVAVVDVGWAFSVLLALP